MYKYLKLILIILLFNNKAFALDLELTQGLDRAIPISFVPFKSTDNNSELSKVIESDLKLSGKFRILNFDSTAHHPAKVSSVNFSYWRNLGANYIVVGSIANQNNSKLVVNFQLIDPISKSHVVLSDTFQIEVRDARALAHHISDLIYQKLTGEKGVFSTRIAYVLVKRKSRAADKYTLEVADSDGHNAQPLLTSSEPIMSPSWSPNGKKIAYVSFENRRAEIYTVDVETGHRRLLSNYPGINGAPAWSPDGKKIALVLSKDGAPKIYLLDVASKNLTQLTYGGSIDTEPSFSINGQNILFTSGRGGAPQLYELSLSTKKVKRVTYAGKYNARGSYTYDGRSVVMQHRKADKFNIAILDIDSGHIIPLTSAKNDESPTVSPNGRLILYATQYNGRGVLSIVSIDGKIKLRLPVKAGDVQEPAWSPYLG